MSKYEVGDVAALFPNPPQPKTESGKKIQSLFKEFYNKPTKSFNKWGGRNQFEGKKKQENTLINSKSSESIADSKPKKKLKRKFQNAIISNAIEDTTTEAIKQKVETINEPAPFPRRKIKKARYSENEGYLPRKKAKENDSENESFLPKKKCKKIISEDESNFSRKNVNEINHKNESSLSKKKRKKNLSTTVKHAETVKDGVDCNSNSQKPIFSVGKKFKNLLDNSFEINKIEQPKSRIIFQMGKKKALPPSENIFEDSMDDDDMTGSDTEIKSNRPKKSARSLKKRSKGKVEETEERISRTLFVGNLPMSITRKALEKLFSPFGPLESCRLRGAVPTKSTITKKIADIQRKFHTGLHSRIGYVVLKNRKDAIEAMSLTGMLIDGHHIVVDRAAASGEKKLYDERRSIFVGNLPFDIEDETIWSAFIQCGDIETVRVIRDKETGAGKGFGYVLFQKIQAKENALNLTNLEIAGRTLRIKSIEKGGRKPQRKAPTQLNSAMRRIAKKEQKKRQGNSNSRKSLKKIMKKGRLQNQKKRIADIFKDLSKK